MSQHQACKAIALSRSTLNYQPKYVTDDDIIDALHRQGVLDMYVFRSLQEVKERTEQWMTDYNEQCPHDSLNVMTPVEYRLFHQPQNSGNTWH